MEGQRKLLCGQTSENICLCDLASGCRRHNTQDRKHEAVAWEPGLSASSLMCKESSEHQPPLEPGPTSPLPRIPEAHGGALSQPWKQQRTEGREATLFI